MKRRTAPLHAAIALTASITACARHVDVEGASANDDQTDAPALTGDPALMGGSNAAVPSANIDDGPAGASSGTSSSARPPRLDLLASAQLDRGLNVVRLPAVGEDRISLLQYTGAGAAVTRHTDFRGAVGTWHASDGAYHIYTAAAGARHLSLVYAGSTYGIYANGDSTELSGTPQTYKEFLAVNEDGFAWVDYERDLGRIVFQTWSGERRALTDDARYRAHIELSRDHIAFVEYADSSPGSVGQVFVQPLAGGDAIAVSPQPRHQDRPAVDAEWVVWEEYLSAADSVIRAYDMTSGSVRELSARVGFRGGADVRDERVVWEELQGPDGDVLVASVTAAGEWVAVGGTTHASAPRLTRDGLIWIEVSPAGEIGILHARWME